MTARAAHEKVELHLVRVPEGGPTVETINTLFKALTGKDSTPEEDANTKAILDEHRSKLADEGKS